eukprot:403372156
MHNQVPMRQNDSSTFFVQNPSRPFLSLFKVPKLLYNVLYLRLIKQENPLDMKHLTTLPEDILLMIVKFLDFKSINNRLMAVNTKMQLQNKDNYLWHKIYMQKYKNPGFKVDKLIWREAYYKKEKQLQKR